MCIPSKFVVSIVAVVAVACGVQAQDLSIEQQDKLLDAERVAARVYEKTGNADGAAKSLEEAGVELIIKGGPALLQKQTNLQVLEAYAEYLGLIETRQDEAAQYLKAVLKANPSRASAYLKLGDLYFRRQQTQANSQYRRISENSYKKYVQMLVQQNVSVLLPDHIIEAVYAGSDICSLARAASQQNKVAELRRFMNPEAAVSRSVAADEAKGPTLKGLYQTAITPVRFAEVDIDNDGESEHRYTAKIQGNCQRNLFYKNEAGQFRYVSNPLFDQYFRSNRICGKSQLFPLRFKDKTYLIEQQVIAERQENLLVFEILVSGEAVQRCQVAALSELQANLTKSCDVAVCDHLAVKVDKIVAADAQVGSEWLVSDVAEQAFSKHLRSDPEVAAYINSQHQYLADLDNDGERELIARLWQQAAGQGLRYSYRLFKKIGEQWQLWRWPDPPSSVVVPDIANDTWFFVESISNTNYVITYTATRTDTAMQYLMLVYHIDSAGIHFLGELRSHRERTVASQ